MTPILEGTYLISILSFLGGLKFLSNPKRAKLGNTLAALGMASAVLISVFAIQSEKLSGTNYLLITSMIVLGTFLGKALSERVKMTEIPQLVSFFNATGGACAFVLGIAESNQFHDFSNIERIVLQIGAATGAIAATGSIVALLKLSGKVKNYHSWLVKFLSRLTFISIVSLVCLSGLGLWPGGLFTITSTIIVTSLLFGVLFVLPIGGADMPVVISLLNAITGIATAFAGSLYDIKVMVAGGILVGASGIFLTIMMCRAMNRSLWKVLIGSYSAAQTKEADEDIQSIKETTISDTAMKLTMANKVAIIPGYGMAVAQAQHLCRQIEKKLIEKNTIVDYIIHPVAGRMPGHMNVLLSEAGVEYEALKEMDEVKEEMESYDCALIIGANDVVNPAAENNPKSPIFGMPIINAHHCQSSVVLKRGMNKGYAGVQNDLFGYPTCHLLFGDAKESLQSILNELKLV